MPMKTEKPVINSVWLSSSTPIKDKKADGSDMVVMFFFRRKSLPNYSRNNN